MFDSYFTGFQIFLLIAIAVFFICSISLFEFSEKKNLSILLLILGVFGLKFFFIDLDPFLHYWDEQYHALVAKNTAKNFLKPTLYPEVILPNGHTAWVNNYIWLHKQPMFLWQMALFIKIFGAKVLAIRFPSAICLTFATWCVYRLGKNFATQRVGYYGAFFFTLNLYLNEVMAGARATDHNDIVFISYVTASLWAFSEHVANPEKKKWIFWIGAFSGMAILTKWLTGLLVYAGWGLYIILKEPKRFYYIKNYIALLKSLAVTILIALPWQIFILIAYPEESRFEYSVFSKHFSEVVEGHEGTNWFYLDNISATLGYMMPFFILMGLVALYRYVSDKKIYFMMMATILGVFGFFTLAVTKMPAFTSITFPYIFLGIGAICESLCGFLKEHLKKTGLIFFIMLVVFASASSLQIEKIQEEHSTWKRNMFNYFYRKDQIELKKTCEELKNYLPDNNYVIFNWPPWEATKVMFYSDYIAYSFLPDQYQISVVKEKKKKIAIIDDANLPSEFLNNKDFTIITTPHYKITRTDTVFIKPKTMAFISTEYDGKAVSYGHYPRQAFIIRSFEDGTCQIKAPNGMNGKVFWELGCLLVFNQHQFTLTERFRLDKIRDNWYRIRTEDGTPLKVKPDGERLVATTSKEFTEEAFQLIPVRGN